MVKPKKQINFFIETEIWKKFSKKCIDQDKSRTEILVSLIKEYIEKN